MNYLDIVLGILLLYGLVKGIMRGLFVELASLIAIVAAIYGATHFSGYVGDHLSKSVSLEPQQLKLIAFAITFVGILFLVSLLGKVLTKIANFAALGIINKLLGAAFGFLKMAFIASAVIMFVSPLNNTLGLIKKETIEGSLLYSKVAAFAPVILPKVMNELDKETS